MFARSKKFIALVLAIWLPLFSSNVLAMPITMHGGSQPSAAHQAHHHQLGANQDQSAPHHAQQKSDCNKCGVCHLACSGYISTATITLAEVQPCSVSPPFFSTAFQSFTSAPLVPPPLARA